MIENTKHTNRQRHQSREPERRYDMGGQIVKEVRADGTVVVDSCNRYRVILHTGKLNEETGEEIIEILYELAEVSSALNVASMYNHPTYHCEEDKRWAEVLDYEEVYNRENGEMINGKRPRKPRAKKPARKSSRALRLAKTG